MHQENTKLVCENKGMRASREVNLEVYISCDTQINREILVTGLNSDGR